MERITDIGTRYRHKGLEQLKKYENTGLDPEEIEQLKKDKVFWNREAVKSMAKLGEIRILTGSRIGGTYDKQGD